MTAAPAKRTNEAAEGRLKPFPVLHAESPVAVAPAALPFRGSLASLLAGHILHDGEVVLLILKPSLWFIVISSLWFGAVALILLIAALIFTNPSPSQSVAYVEASTMLLTGRVVWAILQWMGRFYILTDLRIVRLGGVFSIELFDCPLRKVVRTRVLCSTCERIVRTGSIEVIPADGSLAAGTWQTVACPFEVHDQIVAAVDRAKSGGGYGCG